MGMLQLLVLGFQLDKLPHGTQSLIINIGSNSDPIPPPENDTSTAVLAVEPIVHALITPRPRLYVLPAAVASENGVAMMHVLNRNGVSSSLAAPAVRSFWTKSSGLHVVPVISLETLLSSVPSDVQVAYIRTDMQGHDFLTLSSIGSRLTRVPYVAAETWFSNQYTYKDVNNDFCGNLLPHMLGLGYDLAAVIMLPNGTLRRNVRNVVFRGTANGQEYCNREPGWSHGNARRASNYNEGDAYFKLRGTQIPEPTVGWFDEKKYQGIQLLS